MSSYIIYEVYMHNPLMILDIIQKMKIIGLLTQSQGSEKQKVILLLYATSNNTRSSGAI